ncbi:MAG TPA: PDZ domain-containing protein [Bacteroidota bacterium]
METRGHLPERLLFAGIALLAGVALLVVSGVDKSSAQMKMYQYTTGTWLGVSIQDVTEELAGEKKLAVKEGAYVNEVLDDSPAKDAGIRQGDVIVKFDGRDIDDADDLVRAVRKTDAARSVDIVLNRDGKDQKISVTLRERSPRAQAYQMRLKFHRFPRFFNGCDLGGMELRELTRQLGEYFEAPDGRGVLVAEVDEESAASKAGFKAGDVILNVGGEPVADVDDVWDLLEDSRDRESLKFEVIRRGKQQTLELSLRDLEDLSMMQEDFRYPDGDWAILEPEIPPEDLEKFQFDMKNFQMDMKKFQKELKESMKDLQKNLQKEMRKIKVEVRSVTET